MATFADIQLAGPLYQSIRIILSIRNSLSTATVCFTTRVIKKKGFFVWMCAS